MRLTKGQLDEKLRQNKTLANLNPSLSDTDYHSGQAAVMEPAPCDDALAEAPIQKTDSGRFRVRVTSFRHRLLDEDNLAEKYIVDLCREYGYIPDDCAAITHIETTQRKCAEGETEHVEIIIERI